MKATRLFFKRPWIIIAICVILTGVFGFFITGLGIDNSIRQFLPQKDASYTRLTQTEDEFGSMIVIGVSLESKKGSVLTPENIEVVRKITDRCLDLNEVEGVDSLTHIDYVCESDGSISASQLIPDTYTGSEEDIAQLEGRLAEWSDMYNRVIVNDDNTATQMQITIHSMTPEEKATSKITDAERQQKILEQVRQVVVEECEGQPLIYKIYGDPVVAESARKFMISDLAALIPLVIIVVLLSLFFSFKTVDGTLLPLITVVMSAAWTMGLMSLLGITFTLVSSVIPVALIAVGSAYGIHVLTHYYVALDGVEGELTREKYVEAIFAGLKEVMKAVLLAGITTIVGFISLVSSPIEPLHSFAIFTAIGVGIALLLSITFIPALLLTKDFKKVQAGREKMKHLTEKVERRLERARQLAGGKEIKDASGNTLYNIYHFFCGSRVRLIIFTLAICAISYTGLRMLKIDTAIVNYFPENCELRQDIKSIDKNFAGTNSLYFTIEGQEKGDLTNPEILKAVDDMQEYLAENYAGIGKIVSFTTFIKRINQVWHVPTTEVADAGVAGGADDFGDFGDFGDDFAADDGFDSFDDFGDFGDSADTTAAAEDSDWVDPNIEYAEKLAKPMTTQEVLAMLNRAYIEAGAKKATPEKMLAALEKDCNYNGMAYYEIPYDPAKYPVPTREELSGVVNGYLTLLSGSLDRFVDDEMSPRVMRVTCQLRNHSTEETGDIIAAAKNFAAEHFPEGYTIEATGAGE